MGARAASIEALDDFLDTAVLPLEREHEALLDDASARYGPAGVLAEPLLDLKRRVRTAAAAAGVYGLMVPRELGGEGLGAVDQYETWRHLYARCGPDRLLPYEAICAFTSGPGASLRGLSTKARDEVWPGILSGDKVLCFALTEATGETANAVQTSVVAAGDGYRLRGQKKWVSRGGYADYALTYAATSPAEVSGGGPLLSAFLVPLDQPGVRLVTVNRLFGRPGGEEVTLAFEDVDVPAWQLVGELHDGASVAGSGMLTTTMFTAGRFVGLGEWAVARSAATAERTVPGPAGVPTAVARRLLADCAMEIHALDVLSRHCAARADAGEDVGREVAMVRLTAPEMCSRVYERAMRIEGSESLTNEARLFDGWHQSWIVQVAQAGVEEGIRQAIVEHARDREVP